MAGITVDRAPEPRVLWYGQEKAAPRLHGSVKLPQHCFVLTDVLEDIDCADNVEVCFKRQLPPVELIQRNTGKAHSRHLEPGRERFTPGDDELGLGEAKRLEDNARPTA